MSDQMALFNADGPDESGNLPPWYELERNQLRARIDRMVRAEWGDELCDYLMEEFYSWRLSAAAITNTIAAYKDQKDQIDILDRWVRKTAFNQQARQRHYADVGQRLTNLERHLDRAQTQNAAQAEAIAVLEGQLDRMRDRLLDLLGDHMDDVAELCKLRHRTGQA